MSVDLSQLTFERPTDKVKTINVGEVPARVFDDMRKYEDSARGFATHSSAFEHVAGGGQPRINVLHRPADAQVAQIYRMLTNPASTELERITYFDIGTGRSITSTRPIAGEDWRGVWRASGMIMTMDLDGKEMTQMWRVWEDSQCDVVLAKIEGELENSPSPVRIERLTHDEFKYLAPTVSKSQKLMAFSSTKENGKDFLVYICRLVGSRSAGKPDSSPLTLPMKAVTPFPEKGAYQWFINGISPDDRTLLVTRSYSTSHRSLYSIDISDDEPSVPRQIILPGATEREDETTNVAAFSQVDPSVIYVISNAYGDFTSVVSYNLAAHVVTHITTAEPGFRALRPVPWDASSLRVTDKVIYFVTNLDGWDQLFMLPIVGQHTSIVVEVRLDWEGGGIGFSVNDLNEKPFELVLQLTSFRTTSRLARLDLEPYLESIQHDTDGKAFVNVSCVEYTQAQPVAPTFVTITPKLLRFKSFDGLEIPVMYYYPSGEVAPRAAVIYIHGGPATQATSRFKAPVHGYLLNELNCAVFYPNVRGSSGYGKTFMAADDVEKREDSVRDIGAFLDYISEHMSAEIDPKRIAVMGGSYGGYMTFACLTHFSNKLTCGLANCGISHWPSFLKNTASHRQANRRKEYGDETDPAVQAYLERISPLNNVSKITVPLLISHGDNDTRVPVEEAIRMWDNVTKRGIHTELIIGEKEGHGFKQKTVIEYSNGARMQFLQKFLAGN